MAALRSRRAECHIDLKEEVVETLHRGRVALAGGLWLAIIYAICIGALLLVGVPPAAGMYRFWELLLVGIDPLRHWSLALGLVESFLYGVVGGWAFAAIYNVLARWEGSPARRSA